MCCEWVIHREGCVGCSCLGLQSFCAIGYLEKSDECCGDILKLRLGWFEMTTVIYSRVWLWASLDVHISWCDGSTSQEVPHVQLKVIDLPMDQSLGELLPMEAKLHQRLIFLSWELNVCLPNTIHTKKQLIFQPLLARVYILVRRGCQPCPQILIIARNPTLVRNYSRKNPHHQLIRWWQWSGIGWLEQLGQWWGQGCRTGRGGEGESQGVGLVIVYAVSKPDSNTNNFCTLWM